MKNFLYYNEDSVNSILAQYENGLQTQCVSENSNSVTDTNNISSEESITGNIGAKIMGVGAELTGEKTRFNSGTEAINRLIRDVQEKVLNDYAFDRILDYLKKNGLLISDEPRIGDMLTVKGRLTFFDFEYINLLFSDEGAIKYSNEQKIDCIIASLDEMRKTTLKGKQQTPENRVINTAINEKVKNAKKQMNDLENQRKEFARLIKILQDIVPYKRFIMTNNLLIPIDDGCLRDKPEIIAFKYGGELSLLGYITNIIEPPLNQDGIKKDSEDFEGEGSIIDRDIKEDKSVANSFDELYTSINQIMSSLFGKNERIFIVHPIAIYYDNKY